MCAGKLTAGWISMSSTEHSEYYSNNIQACKSLLQSAFMLWQIAEVWMRPNVNVL